MMRGVSHAARHHPSAGAGDTEEGNHLFPPWLGRCLQYGQALGAVLGIALHELPANLARGQRWRFHINAENGSKPEVLADALMHHLLVHASSARIGSIRPDWQLIVAEHAPD